MTKKKQQASAAAASPRSSPKSKDKQDPAYQPGKKIVESDSEWEDSKSKTLKKKRPSDITRSPNANKTVASTSPSSIPVKKANVLKKPQPISKEADISPAVLETVHEETTTTSTIALKDAPSKPTARATPAHPARNRLRSRSRSPTKAPQKPKALDLNRTRRSMSPPPSSHAGTFRSHRTLSPDIPVSARPGDDNIPPMPSLDSAKENKDDFEWPDDVF